MLNLGSSADIGVSGVGERMSAIGMRTGGGGGAGGGKGEGRSHNGKLADGEPLFS